MLGRLCRPVLGERDREGEGDDMRSDISCEMDGDGIGWEEACV